MEKSDDYYMQKAIEEGKRALREGNWPIGCVIVLNNKIISRAHNEVFTKKNKIAHAELLAVSKAHKILLENPQQAILYTTYEPCPMCFGACILNKIKKVVAAINIENSGAMYLKDHLPKLFIQEKYSIEFTKGVLGKECHHLFMQGQPTKKLITRGIITITNNLENLDI